MQPTLQYLVETEFSDQGILVGKVALDLKVGSYHHGWALVEVVHFCDLALVLLYYQVVTDRVGHGVEEAHHDAYDHLALDQDLHLILVALVHLLVVLVDLHFSFLDLDGPSFQEEVQGVVVLLDQQAFFQLVGDHVDQTERHLHETVHPLGEEVHDNLCR